MTTEPRVAASVSKCFPREKNDPDPVLRLGCYLMLQSKQTEEISLMEISAGIPRKRKDV